MQPLMINSTAAQAALTLFRQMSLYSTPGSMYNCDTLENNTVFREGRCLISFDSMSMFKVRVQGPGFREGRCLISLDSMSMFNVRVQGPGQGSGFGVQGKGPGFRVQGSGYG